MLVNAGQIDARRGLFWGLGVESIKDGECERVLIYCMNDGYKTMKALKCVLTMEDWV